MSLVRGNATIASIVALVTVAFFVTFGVTTSAFVSLTLNEENRLEAAASFDTTAPSAPTLSGTAGDTQNSLSWTTVSDPSTPISYQLFRGTTKIYDGTGTSFTDTGLTNGTSYSYTVKATDGAGNQSVASNTLSLTPSAPTWTCPGALSPTWISGLEHGMSTTTGGGIWTTATGTGAAIDSGTRRTGSYSLRIPATGAALYRGRLYAASSTVWVARFGFRLASLPSADVGELVGMTTLAVSTPPYFSLRYKAATQKLAIGFPGQTIEATSTVAAGTWYVIDLKLDVGANPHTATWRIDGVAQPSASNATGATSVYTVHFGTSGADTFTANYDDWVLSHSAGDYPVGNGKVLGAKPTSMGTNSNASHFQHEDGTALDANTWMRVDDTPMSSLTDYVKQVTASGTSYAELNFEDTTETCIRAVGGRMVYDPLNVNQDNNGKTSVFDGTTESVIYNGIMSAQSTNPTARFALVNRASWSQTAFNGLKARIGYSTDVAPQPQWHSVMLEYEVGTP